MATKERILVYILRRDLRLADNPIFNSISKINQQSQKPFTHLLPIYIFPANQVEISGFISGSDESPYPKAKSPVGGFWRCGPHRVKFLAESVWDLKRDLQKIGSDLVLRAGTVGDAVKAALAEYKDRQDGEVSSVWMTSEEGLEEKREERDVRRLCKDYGIDDFQLWKDEKYFVDDRDLPFKEPNELSDVFTSFRKTVEPLREAPRQKLPRPQSLLPLPSYISSQTSPFVIPDTLEATIQALNKNIQLDIPKFDSPTWPDNVKSAHPFIGGSSEGIKRIEHLITSGSMTAYKDTRNGLLGEDFSTKLSAWLALGCISARQIHWYLMDFEDSKTDLGKGVQGYGKGENKGTAAVRFELLWRDYMRLCTRKFGPRLFQVEGFRHDVNTKWKYLSGPCIRIFDDQKEQSNSQHDHTDYHVLRFLEGKTGTGLIDASQRELFLTGYTSNRARQNVASFLAKHMGVDWRIGAEWYEYWLIDYDVSSNWGNWQYVAGVGNDPRGEQRVFNPIKQALDYDSKGEYIKASVPELRGLGEQGEELMGTFQAWKLSDELIDKLQLSDKEWVQKPLTKINFSLNRRGLGSGGGGGKGMARGRGKGGRGGSSRSWGGNNKNDNSSRKGMMEKAGMTD